MITIAVGCLCISLALLAYWVYVYRPKQKPLLILDMNNVLIYRRYVGDIDDTLPLEDAVKSGRFYIWKRPGLDTFLEDIFQRYTVAVWSSARKHNLDPLCSLVFSEQHRAKLLFEWSQVRCTPLLRSTTKQKQIFAKPLQTVWDTYPQYTERNTIIVDDSSAKMTHNPRSCVILVKPWTPLLNHSLPRV